MADPSTYRPQTDAYTGMLLISLVALVAGSAFLFMDYSQYPTKKPDEPPKVAPALPKPEAPAVKAPEPAPAPPPEEKKDEEKKDA